MGKIKALLENSPKRHCKGACHYSPELKEEIVLFKQTHQSFQKAIKQYSTFTNPLSLRTIQTWKRHYKQHGNFTDMRVRNGKSTRLCGDMQQLVYKMYREHRFKGCFVTTRMLTLLAKVCVVLQQREGKHVQCCAKADTVTYEVVRLLRSKWRIVYRAPTTDRVPLSDEHVALHREKLQEEVCLAIVEHGVDHPSPIVNLDELGKTHISNRRTTLDDKGAHRVPIVNSAEKRAVTVLVAGSAYGNFLPSQIIYRGKTDEVHPKNFQFPTTYDITHSENNWCTHKTMMRYIDNVLVPYFTNARQIYSDTGPGLVIMDGFSAHLHDEVYKKFHQCNIVPIVLPPNLTHFMQPMDLTVCGVYKHHVQVAQEDATMKALEAALPPNIDTLSVEQLAEYIGQMPKGFVELKTASAAWFVAAHSKVKEEGALIVKGFEKAGLLDCITSMFK